MLKQIFPTTLGQQELRESSSVLPGELPARALSDRQQELLAEQTPWISHSIHTTSLGRLWRSSKGVSSVLVSTLRITTSSRAMLLTFYMWANSGKGKGKCKYGKLKDMHKGHKWQQNNTALQNLHHFKNNQHSWLPVIICFIYSFYNAKKINLQLADGSS